MKVTKANPRRENPVKWLREVQVANTEIIKFKTNTGAVVTCLPEEIYFKSKVSLGPIKISKKKLFGADQKCLSVERSTYWGYAINSQYHNDLHKFLGRTMEYIAYAFNHYKNTKM